ncbi:MAG: hypothetical protein M3N21_02515 [Actinomycetota bacterium]|nr:hypothetical protein [Actinomycetota bacterium]
MRRSLLLSLASAGSLVMLVPAIAASSFVGTGPASGIRFCYFAAVAQGSGNGVTAARPTSCRDTHVQSAIRKVVGELNALADQPRGRGTCVRDNGSETRLVIRYRDGHSERVDVHDSGCQVATHPPRMPKDTTQAVRQDVARRAGFSGPVA